MKDLFLHIQFFDGAIREYLSELKLQILAFSQAPEIIEVHKTAAKQVFPKALRLFLAERKSSAGLDNIQVRIFEQIRIHDRDGMGSAIVSADSGKSFDAPHELAIGCGIVGRPGSETSPAAAFSLD